MIVRDGSALVITAVVFRPLEGVADEWIPHQMGQMDARDGTEKRGGRGMDFGRVCGWRAMHAVSLDHWNRFLRGSG